jgi:hypothetical protein
MVRLARRPRPAPELVAAGRMPWRDVTRLASTSHVCGWLGWVHYRPRGCVGGRPRRGGTPVRDETVTAGCPRNYPVVPRLHSRPTIGQLPRSSSDLFVRRPGRPDEHLATRPHHRQFPHRTRTNRSALHPLAFPMGSTPLAAQTRPAHLRRTDARAVQNRANPANSRPQSDNRRAMPSKEQSAQSSSGSDESGRPSI